MKILLRGEHLPQTTLVLFDRFALVGLRVTHDPAAKDAMAVSFIHPANWQIGKVFSTIGGDAAVLLKTRRVKTVQRVAQLATERHLDALLVAGDVFENNLVSNEAIHALVHEMAGFTGPWVLNLDNHYPAIAESVWQRIKTLGCPKNV